MAVLQLVTNTFEEWCVLTENKPLKGIFLCLVSYFFISLIGICQKSISSEISIPVILFFQNIICLTLLMPNLIKGQVGWIQKNQFGTYFIRIASGLGCYAALFIIIRFIPISEALIYQYSASLWIPFIMFLWLKEKMDKKLWWGIVIGFMGILLILQPDSSIVSFISILGIVCGLLQGLSMVAVRKLAVTEPTVRILFYYFLISTLIVFPMAIMNWAAIAWYDLIFLIGVGLSTYLAQKFFAISLKFATPAVLAPVCYTCILYSGVIGWLFWNEIPEGITLAGMILIVFGCLLTIFMSRVKTITSPTIQFNKLETVEEGRSA